MNVSIVIVNYNGKNLLKTLLKSILESFKIIEGITGKPMKYVVKEAREGDHKVYISDLGKFKKHYPKWDIKMDLKKIFVDLYNSMI